MALKPLDYGVCVLALAFVAVTAAFTFSGGGDQNRITLKSDGGVWVFPHDAVETVTVPGPLGDTVVEIQGGQARIVSSPCANQTCVAAGAVHSHGQWLACLPNRVLVSVDGEAGKSNDRKSRAVKNAGSDASQTAPLVNEVDGAVW
ncbi:MAG: NusG domain II-containing protein [Treponema sp.]|jgi:hypothetical protein|nr:NusG domain II-containing protein [Treponema sp.]